MMIKKIKLKIHKIKKLNKFLKIHKYNYIKIGLMNFYNYI